MAYTVRERLIQSFAAQGFGQVITIVIQVLSIPLFLTFWGAHLYGEWLLLSTIPSYITLSNLGFGIAAATEMTLSVARGDKERALNVFQSTWIFISAISLFLIVLFFALVFFIPITGWLNLQLISLTQAREIIILFILQLALLQHRGMYDAMYRTDGNFARGVTIFNIWKLAEFVASALVVWRGGGPVAVAGVVLGTQVVATALVHLDLRRLSPWLIWGWSQARVDTLKQIAGPAIGFVGFPIGYALSIQGMTMVIGIFLGPAVVVAFSTTRTLTRFVWQIMNAISNSTQVEFSVAMGKNDIDLARHIHRRSCQLAVWLTAISSIVLALTGRYIYTVWTKGKVQYDPVLFGILLFASIADTVWSTSYAVPLAINKHQKMAGIYVGSTTISLAAACVLASVAGLHGAALSLLIVSVIMNIYVLRLSLSLVNDSIAGFTKSVCRPPIKETQRLFKKFFKPKMA